MITPYTKIDIINLALDAVGEPPISNPTLNEPIESLANRNYDIARFFVLETSKWHIALRLDDLAQTTNPEGDWPYAFQLPTDWLHTFDSSLGGYTCPQRYPYQLIGERLHTTASSVRILYARNVENVSEMPAALVDAIAARLAVRLCIPIKGNDQRRRELLNVYEETLASAQQSGAIIDPTSIWGADFLTDARRGTRTQTNLVSSSAGYP